MTIRPTTIPPPRIDQIFPLNNRQNREPLPDPLVDLSQNKLKQLALLSRMDSLSLSDKRIKVRSKTSHSHNREKDRILKKQLHLGEARLFRSIKSDKQKDTHDFILKEICRLINRRLAKAESLMTHLRYIWTSSDHEQRSRFLGVFLYFLDKDPYFIRQEAEALNSSKFVHWLMGAFQNELATIEQKLCDLNEICRRVGLQDPELAYKTTLTLEIAQLLVTKRRFINHRLIPLLIDSFIKNKQHPLNHEYSLMNGLKMIYSNKSIRSKLRKIQKPHSRHKLAHDLIRTQLRLPASAKIGRRDTLVTVMTACLSRMRQGSIGSCFATHLAIVLHSSHLEHCLDDFIQLVAEGKLTKIVNNTNKTFPFLLRIDDHNLSNSILELSIIGELRCADSGKINIWDYPGIQSALQVIGIDTPAITIRKALEALPQKEHERDFPIKVNIQTFLKTVCVEYLKENELPDSGLLNIFSLACFAFHTQTRNGILSIWGNSLAGMAEGKNGSMIKPSILNAICKPISQMVRQQLGKNEKAQASAKILIEHLKAKLWESVYLHYDPYIQSPSFAPETKPPEGGFVVYEVQKQHRPSKWLRIDTPELYQEFIAGMIEKSKEFFQEIISQRDPKMNFEDFHQHLCNYVKSPAYLKNSMLTYFPDYKIHPNLITEWEDCPYTPWRTLSGNVAQTVHEVYLELDSPFPTKPLDPADPQRILHYLIENIRLLARHQNHMRFPSPHRRAPLLTPTHALTLLPAHPSLVEAALSPLTPGEWIEQQIIRPGLEVSNSKASTKTIDHAIEWVKKELPNRSIAKRFEKEIFPLPQDLSIFDFRNYLVEKLGSIDPSFKEDPEKTHLLETEICLSLTEEQQTKLQSATVHFADTNWNESVHDINLCIAIQPCKGALSILEIQDDNQFIRPVSDINLLQGEWNYCLNSIETMPYHLKKINSARKLNMF